MRFPIGTQYIPHGRKNKTPHTVVDYLTTTNLKGEVVKTRYVSSHKFLGQEVFDYDVCEVTIARGNPKLP